jgi:hypothetical protein
VDVVAEYWPAAEDPAVVFRTERFDSLKEIEFMWGDLLT